MVATDASLTGFGVVSSFWKVEDVAAVGQELERGRFRKFGSHSAREAALAAAGFVRDSNTADWKAGWVSDDEYLQKWLGHQSEFHRGPWSPPTLEALESMPLGQLVLIASLNSRPEHLSKDFGVWC